MLFEDGDPVRKPVVGASAAACGAAGKLGDGSNGLSS